MATAKMYAKSPELLAEIAANPNKQIPVRVKKIKDNHFIFHGTRRYYAGAKLMVKISQFSPYNMERLDVGAGDVEDLNPEPELEVDESLMDTADQAKLQAKDKAVEQKIRKPKRVAKA